MHLQRCDEDGAAGAASTTATSMNGEELCEWMTHMHEPCRVNGPKMFLFESGGGAVRFGAYIGRFIRRVISFFFSPFVVNAILCAALF